MGRFAPGLIATLALAAGMTIGGMRTPAAADSPVAPALTPRAYVPFISRDVLPDLRVTSIRLTETLEFGAAFTYRIQNRGMGNANLAQFTIQAWFSADSALQKDRDLQGAILSISPFLRAGETYEGEAQASNASADTFAYPYLIIEVDSAGAVAEEDYSNNSGVVRRPPGGLLSDVVIAWDLAGGRATVTWAFNGAARGLADLGFRVALPGFGAQEVPPGTRSLEVPFAPLTGAKPCSAAVSALNSDGYYWPPTNSNSLCSPGR